MFVSELFEDNARKVLIVYPGRFQPFHKGHKSVYDHLVKQFSYESVYIVTSGKTEPLKSPFQFAEKKEMMQLAGIDPARIIQSTQPYRALELTQRTDPDNTILIFAISEKDMAEDPRFAFTPKKDGSPSYFQPFKSIDASEPLSKHGYITTVPTVAFNVLGKPANSATQIRDLFKQSDEDTQKKIVVDLFGAYDENVFRTMQSRLQAAPVTEGLQKPRYNLRFESKDLDSAELKQYFFQKWSSFIDQGLLNDYPTQRAGRVHSWRALRESTESNEIAPVIANVKSMGLDDSARISIGDSLSCLELDVVFATREMDVAGFTKPKKVIKVNEKNRVLTRIYFDDGSVYPHFTPATFNGQPIDYSIFFTNDNAEKALTYLTVSMPNGWELHDQVSRRQDTLGEDAAGVGLVTGTGITKDVRPGELKRQAAKFGNTVDANGIPAHKMREGSKMKSKDVVESLESDYADGMPKWMGPESRLSDKEKQQQWEYTKRQEAKRAKKKMHGGAIWHSKSETNESVTAEANEAMTSAIVGRIMRQHPDALKKYGPERIMDVAQEEAEFWGGSEEIGSSDVSIAVRSALSSLAEGGE